LRRSDVPAPGVSPTAAESMRRHAVAIANALEHVGVLAVEYFVIGERVLVNEIAPRVHNSGHLTIEHARTSQFENHIRAVCGLPLGSTEARFPTATMINGIGRHPEGDALPGLGFVSTAPAAGAPDPRPSRARWHDYGKSPRRGRKLGHLTLVADRLDEERIADLEAVVPGGEGLTAGSPD
ncbi:MAG: ATP-grasp domain-containing protein, partial [Planctomycetota bacterium]|nr:ATP-grasp domain-containing protein [Planctomycetota bacterium]